MSNTRRPKQVILVRRDLHMRRASLAALIADASTKFFVDNDESERFDKLSVNLTQEETEWIASGSSRIVLGVSSESDLRGLHFKAEMAGLQCYPVFGTEEDSQEFYCVAIGPNSSDKIDEITKNLSLL